jgi:hypothetical protein
MLIVFHGGNAGSFSHGFANRLDIEADVIVQAEEIPVWRIPQTASGSGSDNRVISAGSVSSKEIRSDYLNKPEDMELAAPRRPLPIQEAASYASSPQHGPLRGTIL